MGNTNKKINQKSTSEIFQRLVFHNKQSLKDIYLIDGGFFGFFIPEIYILYQDPENYLLKGSIPEYEFGGNLGGAVAGGMYCLALYGTTWPFWMITFLPGYLILGPLTTPIHYLYNKHVNNKYKKKGIELIQEDIKEIDKRLNDLSYKHKYIKDIRDILDKDYYNTITNQMKFIDNFEKLLNQDQIKHRNNYIYEFLTNKNIDQLFYKSLFISSL